MAFRFGQKYNAVEFGSMFFVRDLLYGRTHHVRSGQTRRSAPTAAGSESGVTGPVEGNPIWKFVLIFRPLLLEIYSASPLQVGPGLLRKCSVPR